MFNLELSSFHRYPSFLLFLTGLGASFVVAVGSENLSNGFFRRHRAIVAGAIAHVQSK
jgi:hypothetical protein